MKYGSFHESRFRSAVDKALQQVQQILDNTRNPRIAEDEDHTYEDKYGLAEYLTNASLASYRNVLLALGLDDDKYNEVSKWVNEEQKSVILRFASRDSCVFLKEQSVNVLGHEQSVESTTEATGFFGTGAKTEKKTSRVVMKIKEYHWNVLVNYKISIETSNKKPIELMGRSSSTVIITAGGQARGGAPSKPPPPLPENTLHAPVDMNLTWLFRMMKSPTEVAFSIDRNSEKAVKNCKTPRRNDDVDEAVEFARALATWAHRSRVFFTQRIEEQILAKHAPVESNDPNRPLEPGMRCVITGLTKEPTFNGKHVVVKDVTAERIRVEPENPASGLPGSLSIKPANLQRDESTAGILSSINVDTLFVPIVPLLENEKVLPDVEPFLKEQSRTIDDLLQQLSRVYPPHQLERVPSITEAKIVVLTEHMMDLTHMLEDSLDYLEDMLKQQLMQAIGREITSKDIDQFMRFHGRKLFSGSYAPNPFSYAIRREGHFPDGILSIEGSFNKNVPIDTMVRRVEGASHPSIFMPINAGCSVEITGDRYLHGWMQYRFKARPKEEFTLVARTRQFSSFLLILGTMAGANKFDPKEAIILQNKDEVLIPLLTNPLPTAKDFKDAIASMSPEQQEFARAFRAMQLESSVFGVCVIQLKPALEKVLGLPQGALTKEIKLTQELLSLFVEYQIPSDLMSYDGPVEADQAFKLDYVKGCVKNVLEVIDSSKERQLIDEERKADMRDEMAYKDSVEFHDDDTNHMMYPRGADDGSSIRNNSRRRLKKQSPVMSLPASKMMMAAISPSEFGRESALPPPPAAMASESRPVIHETSSSRHARSHAEPVMELSTKPIPVQPLRRGEVASETAQSDGEDFTLIPKILDAKLEKLDEDNALRSTVIKPGDTWSVRRQKNLLTPVMTSTLGPSDLDVERKGAYDLLDAISRSGALPIACAELHVVICLSHVFENSVMGTVIQDNINPIEKAEKSSLLLATTIYGIEDTRALLQDDAQVDRLVNSFPRLFEREQ